MKFKERLCKDLGGMRLTDYIEQYQRLAAAVVAQAVTDYKRALKRRYRYPSFYSSCYRNTG